MRQDLPSGTVTFLFTDVEGSTRLLREIGEAAYAGELAEHRRTLRAIVAENGGSEVDTEGDAFFVAFTTPTGALRAADAIQRALEPGRIHVRIGIHTGMPIVTDEGYVGMDVHKGARIAAAGHGGQVLVSAATAALVDHKSLVDLGLHRLKDLLAPEHIYQLGPGEFPPLKSLHRTNLPVAPTPFIGREGELAAVVELLAGGTARTVTLTGPGGMGKTRLALQAAANCADDYPAGVFWVPLADIADPALVLDGVAAAVGAREPLAQHIADKRMLLLLDNFEHLTDAAIEVARLSSQCPNLVVLATSRERLRIAGEIEYAVPALTHGDAVTLFTTRAQALDASFVPEPAVDEICRRLDELPLALELAASRVKVLTPQQILERLDRRLSLLIGGARDLPERQRTLRAAIEWSHDLLEADDRRLFAHLAVFSGGWRLEAAEDVATADLDHLSALVDRSLVQHVDERFAMLETIREFAVEQLDAHPEAEHLRSRHANYFLALAESTQPLVAQYAGHWLDRIEAEHGNMRAALDWFKATGDVERLQRLTAALADFWVGRAHFVEARQRLRVALAADQRPTAARAATLVAAADMLFDEGKEARDAAQEALAISRGLNDMSGIAYALLILGTNQEGDWPRAREYWEESAALFRTIGDDHHARFASRMLAWAMRELGDPESAEAMDRANLTEAREVGDLHIEALSLEALGARALERGETQEAMEMTAHAFRIHQGLNDAYRAAICIARLAPIVERQRRSKEAVMLLSTAERQLTEIGAEHTTWVVSMMTATRTRLELELDRTEFQEAWERGRYLTPEAALELARAVEPEPSPTEPES